MQLSSFVKIVKSTLEQIIAGFDTSSDQVVMHPGRDFTRNRKLGCVETVMLPIMLADHSLPKEMADIFRFAKNRATVSAFTQQRGKIRPGAL